LFCNVQEARIIFTTAGISEVNMLIRSPTLARSATAFAKRLLYFHCHVHIAVLYAN